MTGYLKIAGSAIVYGMIATSPVQATEPERNIEEGQGVVTTLGGDTSAITYWVSQDDGWHVVTTVDTKTSAGSDTDKHAVVRFSAVLQPGQSHSISIPVAIGEKQPVLLIRRVADRIEVDTDAALLN
ncbi:MAG TPA: hypothetical protein VK602_10485 [Phyllobacterium sp.]|jgi:hypothetical protein|nr:hypothetical protein [Phyllobacterium sp.]